MADIDFAQTGAIALTEEAPQAAPQIVKPDAFETLKSFFGLSGSLKRTSVENPASAPWSGVTLLNFFKGGSFLGFATGFLIKPDLLITAAHNLQLTQPTAVGLYPGYDAVRNPTAVISGRAWAWHGERDVAAIVLPVHVAATMTMKAPVPGPLTLAGYAYPYDDDRPRMTAGTAPWTGEGHHIHYRIGVYRGDSGAPVFAEGQTGGVASAIHSESKIALREGGLIGVGEAISPELLTIIADLEARARAI